MFRIVRVDYNGADDAMITERKALGERDDVELTSVSAIGDEQIISAAKDADVVITHFAELNRNVLQSLPKLKAIVRYGIGYDSVDVAAATELGVLVVNIPNFCNEEVANHTMAMLLSANRKIVYFDKAVRRGEWESAKKVCGPVGSLYGETLGIIGCGNLGRIVAKRAQAFNMNVIGYDKYLPVEIFKEFGIEQVSMEELLERADYISVHVALTEQTRHMISENEFKKMKTTCTFINASRGSVVDEKALINALVNKEIGTACLDVFEKEPIEQDNQLKTLENVILTSHFASYSDRSFSVLKTRVMNEALAVKDGELPSSIVNKEVIEKYQSKWRL